MQDGGLHQTPSDTGGRSQPNSLLSPPGCSLSRVSNSLCFEDVGETLQAAPRGITEMTQGWRSYSDPVGCSTVA